VGERASQRRGSPVKGWEIRERLEKDLKLDEKAPVTTIDQAFWFEVKERVDGTDRATDHPAVRHCAATRVVETAPGESETVVETHQRLSASAVAAEVPADRVRYGNQSTQEIAFPGEMDLLEKTVWRKSQSLGKYR
jgi:hypothetical protein